MSAAAAAALPAWCATRRVTTPRLNEVADFSMASFRCTVVSTPRRSIQSLRHALRRAASDYSVDVSDIFINCKYSGWLDGAMAGRLCRAFNGGILYGRYAANVHAY